MNLRTRRLELAGWGRYPRAEGDALRPERLRTLHEAVASDRSLIARGLGRSYGDAAVNSAGVTVLMERLDRMLAFDEVSGALECEAGVSLRAVIATFMPRGWLPPVLPGTRHVTIGGAIACDIHGKNHHRDGAFGRHVLSFRLLSATGRVLACSRSENADLFWATIGGMGLTGIILDARLQLRPRTGNVIIVDRARTRDLDGAIALFDGSDEQYAYSVAWIDCTARGAALGRSVLMRGNEEIAPLQDEALPGERVGVPSLMPNVLTRSGIRAFNELYYRTHRTRSDLRVTPDEFFFPLDRIANWNRMYGPSGFVQYQCVVPESRADALPRLLESISRSARGSFLAVLKKFGTGEAEQLLSFPQRGYTLAVDFPATPDVMTLLDGLDEITVGAGGRVYLAKDARMQAGLLAEMYPRLAEWREIRTHSDPERRFISDLGVRLGLA